MRRDVERELLDELPAADPRAVRARQDLQTVHTWMGTTRIMARLLATTFGDRPPASITELGAGDGTLLLRVAQLLAPRWQRVHVVMVDRQRLVSPKTRAAFESLSWRVESVQADVFDWLERPHATESDVMIANLFLHHFAEADLGRLLRQASDQTGCFLACEPASSASRIESAANRGGTIYPCEPRACSGSSAATTSRGTTRGSACRLGLPISSSPLSGPRARTGA